MAAIEFNNISKQYRLGLVSTHTLSHDLNRWWKMNILRREDPYLKIGEANDRSTKGDSEYVWALKDIDFKVEQGDVLGIIGKNGAGKSTLLKILSRVTSPSTGTIKAKGRIASLLEVGTGFHPEMTGRENIFMNGSIMGMTKPEIRSKLDEIVDFAGVERYLDTPVKRYSSGMMVRLGFAIAAHLEPEILVVDEVLAVGDAEFQKKAIGKMQDVSQGDGRTVLFVSHNMASIKTLCNKGVLLENGTVSTKGNIEDVVNKYLDQRTCNYDNILEKIIYRTDNIKISDISINNQLTNYLDLQDDNVLDIQMTGELSMDMYLSLEIRIYDRNSVLLASYVPGYTKNSEQKKYKRGTFKFKDSFEFPKNITKGEYFLELSLTQTKIEELLTFSMPIQVKLNGFISEEGTEFDYKWNGLLLL